MKVAAMKKKDKRKEMKGDGKGEKRARPEGIPPSSLSQKKTLVV